MHCMQFSSFHIGLNDLHEPVLNSTAFPASSMTAPGVSSLHPFNFILLSPPHIRVLQLRDCRLLFSEKTSSRSFFRHPPEDVQVLQYRSLYTLHPALENLAMLFQYTP